RDWSATTSSTARSVEARSVSPLFCNADRTVGERKSFRSRTTFVASGRSYLCHSKRCAALIASAITRSEFMRHKTHAELWRATPYSACPKNILFGLFVSKPQPSLLGAGMPLRTAQGLDVSLRPVARLVQDEIAKSGHLPFKSDRTWGRKFNNNVLADRIDQKFAGCIVAHYHVASIVSIETAHARNIP